ncbi:MAG: PKD domain-containing protein [Deltaproteobacteria bacterium]|nr:PKD domain-containing protein [Deltaproteobacteria bacterium]
MTRLHLALAAVALIALGTTGCGGNNITPADAPVVQDDGGAPQQDAAVTSDGGLLVADFVAQGCERLEEWSVDGGSPDADGGIPSGTVCLGHAPLTLNFIPVASENVESYVWTFGEPNETPLREPTPTHTFVLPGSFDVTLTVGGPAGTLSVKHVPPFVQVLANPTGWPCDQAEQCEGGLQCACPHAESGDPACPAAFGGRGLCTRGCSGDADCGTDSACIDVNLAAPSPWREPLCLATCASTTVCPTGLACRDLPAKQSPSTWVSACFPEFLGDVGVPCLDADGAAEWWTCVGGVCLELGSFGYCSAACEGECPEGSACARVGGAGGHSVCLASCDSIACTDDPLLGCEAPDPTGKLGFEIVDSTPTPGATYCAPRRCTGPADCEGLRCTLLDGASFCQPNP